MQTVDLIITAPWIVPIIPRNTVLTDHALVIDEGQIIAILPRAQVAQEYRATTSVDRPNHILMPGLINAHTHAAMVLFRGLADDLPLLTWLQEHMWPAEGAVINEETVFLGTQLAMAEMIRGGTTCFNDMYFYFGAVARAVTQAKMRAVCSMTIMNIPTHWAQNDADYIEKARRSFHQRPDNALLTWLVAPHASYTNTDAGLQNMVQLSEELGIGLHTHAHETEAEIALDVQQFGQRSLARLAQAGVLKSGTSLAHAVHLQADEIAQINHQNVSVVHCPESNLKLGSGFADMVALTAQGINVAMGTDGAASNNDLDMFGELRTAGFLAKGLHRDPQVFPAHQLLEMATINGAKALGLEAVTGSLEIGKAADVIAIDVSSYCTQPMYEVFSTLVYAVNRLQVSDVWVQGNALLHNSELTTIDTNAVLTAIKPWQEKIRAFGVQGVR